MMKMFGLNGLLGLLIAVVLVLVLAFLLGKKGVETQAGESTNYYSIDKNAIKMKSVENASSYKLEKEQK